MSEEEQIQTFIPGDPIEWLFTFVSTQNIRGVTAMFVREGSGEKYALAGEAKLMEKTAVLGWLTHQALLRHDPTESDGLVPGVYRLRFLQADSYGNKRLDFDNPPEEAFRFEDEDDELPRSLLPQGPIGFVLDERHSHRRPSR